MEVAIANLRLDDHMNSGWHKDSPAWTPGLVWEAVETARCRLSRGRTKEQQTTNINEAILMLSKEPKQNGGRFV